MNGHVEDLAELYALGALDDDERENVDAHLLTCERCSRAVGIAEESVELMVATEASPISGNVVAPPPPRHSFALRASALAIAAAFLIGFLPTVYFVQQTTRMQTQMAQGHQLARRLASGKYRRVAFTGSPNAQVLYAPDGSWYCIIVNGSNKLLRVAWKHHGVDEMLGQVAMQKNAGILYLPKSHRMNELALLDGNAVVGTAKLAF